MNLNPKKCSLRVSAGKFFRFVNNKGGTKANPAKLKIILDIQRAITVKKFQKLKVYMAANGRFVSNFVQKCLPFYECTRLTKDLKWTAEAEEAFKQL